VWSISFPEAERGSSLPVVCPKNMRVHSDEQKQTLDISGPYLRGFFFTVIAPQVARSLPVFLFSMGGGIGG
jgi:hypothetical protein